MKKKFFTVLLALVLVCSFSMVTAVPVMAVDPPGEGTQLLTEGAEGPGGVGDTDTIVVSVPAGTTLGNIVSISWDEYLVTGYAPHVDIMLDMDGDGAYDEALVVEFANNHPGASRGDDTTESVWGCDVGTWVSTFDNDPTSVTTTSSAWLATQASGGTPETSGTAYTDLGYLFYFTTIEDWAAGSYVLGIDAETPVTHLEIEVDNWIMNTEAYVNNIELNGSAQTPVLEVNDENPWTSAFTFTDIEPGGDPMAFDFKLHNVGNIPGVLTFEMSYVENDMDGAPYPNMSAGEFASLIYVEDVHYQYIWLDDPDNQPDGYIGSVKPDLDEWLLMDSEDAGGNMDDKVSLYEICQVGPIQQYDPDGGPLNAGAEITYFIEFQLGGSLEGGVAGGAILTDVANNSQGDGVSVTITATLETDIEESSGNVFQAFGVAGPVLNDTTDVTYDTIQLAIDNAEEGDTINVAAGTYDENITIDKSLIVEGAQAGVNARARTGPESIINAQGVPVAVLINGADTVATFDGFTVDNYDTIGILGGALKDTLQEVPLGDDPIAVHILNNIVMPPTVAPPHNNNIQVGAGTTGTIIGNEVSGALLESPDWSGSGILVSGSSNVVVSNNYVHNSEGGIQIQGYGGPLAEKNHIENNLVENCKAGISVQGYSIDTIIRYNDVLNNDTGIGSLAYDYYAGGVWSEAYRIAPSGTEVHYNNIDGNVNYGVKSSVWFYKGLGLVLAEQVDAAYNWWGDPCGPDGDQSFSPFNGLLPGNGDKVSSKVKCMPWLTRPFEKVIGDDIAYFGISAPVLKGWNIVSAPLALDVNVSVTVDKVEYTANTWGGLLNLGKKADVDDYALKQHYSLNSTGGRVYTPISYYDSDPDSPNKGWRQVTELTEINPLEAYYIRMMESDSIPIMFSPALSVPSKELYQGWNLVGCAYLDVQFAKDGQPLETALATIAEVSSTAGDVKGYAQVVSPSVNQKPWIFIPPAGAGEGTYIPTDAVGTMLIGKGYWVFMENPGTLAGLTFTPITLP